MTISRSNASQNYDARCVDLGMALGLLVRRMRAAAPCESRDLSWTQKAVMKRLEEGGPTTIADLARAESVKPQSMGTAIGTLEELGLVERTPHPTDGRQMHIQLTRKGMALRKSSTDAKLSWLAGTIAKLNKQEQAIVFEAGDILKRLVEL